MAWERYHLTVKSDELRGASQFNGMTLRFASDADAIQFAANLEMAVAGDVVTVTKEIAANYTRPYPAGTGVNLRSAMWDDTGGTAQMRIADLSAGADIGAFDTGVVAAGIGLPNLLEAATKVNSYRLDAS